MKKLYFCVAVFALVLVGKLWSEGRIESYTARFQYEAHFDYNGNYELPPIMIEFRHASDATVADSLLDLTNGAPVEVMIPLFHGRTDPIDEFDEPDNFDLGDGNEDLENNEWSIIEQYINVLTFDSTNFEQIVVRGNAAASFDTAAGLISQANFLVNSPNPSPLDFLRSVSDFREPTGKFINRNATNDYPVGADIFKGSTFFINRIPGSFIGYNPEEEAEIELPYIVISGLRVWTGPLFLSLSGDFTEDSSGSWVSGYHNVGQSLVENNNGPGLTSIDLVATVDNVNCAYRMVLRVSDDDGVLDFLGNLDEDVNGIEIPFDATPFKNLFYVGGPRVTVDEPATFNLFTELSKPIGQFSDFPNVSIALPRGRITADTASLLEVSLDKVMPSVFEQALHWNYLASVGAGNRPIVRLDLPGTRDELGWADNNASLTAIVKTSNLNTYPGIDPDGLGGGGTKIDRGLQLFPETPSVGNFSNDIGKSLSFRLASNQMFTQGVQQSGAAGTFFNLAGASFVKLPESRWRDGPLRTDDPDNDTEANSIYWSNENVVFGAAGNGGVTGLISEAITFSNLQVKGFVNTINPSQASELILPGSNSREPSQLYGQLGMQLFNDGSPDPYYKAVADNFVIISGGPVLTVTQDVSGGGADALVTDIVSMDGGPLRLLPLTIVHDQNNWVDVDQGLKLSFKPNSGLYFIPDTAGTVEGPEEVQVKVGTAAEVDADVNYEDFVLTGAGRTLVSDGLLARSIVIDMPTGPVYEADLPVVISGANSGPLLVTFDPVYIRQGVGWPLRLHTSNIGGPQGLNGPLLQSIEGSLLLINRDFFNIDAVLDPGGINTVLANLVRADNVGIVPPDLGFRSARSIASTTFDHITFKSSTAPAQIDAVSMDALHIQFANDFSGGDLFIHLPSQLNGRVGVGTFDSTKTLLNFGGSAAQNFNAVDVTYGTAGRYVRIRREFLAPIKTNDDLVVTGLRFFPSGESVINRLIAGYPDESGLDRLTTVTDSRVYSFQQVNAFLDRPLLLNPVEFSSRDTIFPFPDIFVSHDARDQIQGGIRQDNSGDLRFALPGTAANLQWSSDFSRVVYFFTTRDRTGPFPGDFTFGTDNSFTTNNPTILMNAAQITAASADAVNQVSRFIDTTIINGNQGGQNVGIRTVEQNKILGLNVVNNWPPASTLRIKGLLVRGLDQTNSESSHISNNLPTYATLTSGPDSSLLEIPGGQFSDIPVLGHLAVNYLNNNRFQTFTPEPVYTAGTLFSGVTQAFSLPAGGTIPSISVTQDNLNPLTIIVHESTDFQVDFEADPPSPFGLARGITSDGIRLTFPFNSPLRFLTADTVAQMNSNDIEPFYENIDKTFGFSEPTSLNDYGGFARTAYLRGLVYNGGPSPNDVLGFIEGPQIKPGGAQILVTGLTVVNVKQGTTAFTGYAPGHPVGNIFADFEFGREGRVPGLMLSLSSAGAVDAYLFEAGTTQNIIINTGSSTTPTTPSTSTDGGGDEEESGGGGNSVFNACLISQPRDQFHRR